MDCFKCRAEMGEIHHKTNNGNSLIVFRCSGCGYEKGIEDPEIAKLFVLKRKLLDPENHTHKAFVYQAIARNGHLSTIGLMALCLDAGITNGSREARVLKEIGLLDNYKEFKKRYVVWHIRELV